MKISRVLVGLVMFSIAVGAWAEVIDVSVGGDIAAAVAAAKDGDVVKLAADSPFIASGTSVVQTLDLDGNPIPATPAIGCFQSVADSCLSVDRHRGVKGESINVHVTFIK